MVAAVAFVVSVVIIATGVLLVLLLAVVLGVSVLLRVMYKRIMIAYKKHIETEDDEYKTQSSMLDKI